MAQISARDYDDALSLLVEVENLVRFAHVIAYDLATTTTLNLIDTRLSAIRAALSAIDVEKVMQ